MKVKIFMALMSLFLMTIITSCNNDIEKNDETRTLIKAKWEISDPNSAYTSFEFTEDGNFIVVENGTTMNTRTSSSDVLPVHFGIYQIDGNTIVLPDFGTITVTSISAENFSFSFTLKSTGESRNFATNKVREPITPSSRTDMICRTWKINKVIIDEDLLPEAEKNWYEYYYGHNWKEEAEKELLGTVVLYTKAGTYLISYGENYLISYPDRGSNTALPFWWKWANKEETAFYYSENNWQDNWQGYNVLIKELTDKTLTMQDQASITYELGLYFKD
jgi:hypothetical protein